MELFLSTHLGRQRFFRHRSAWLPFIDKAHSLPPTLSWADGARVLVSYLYDVPRIIQALKDPLKGPPFEEDVNKRQINDDLLAAQLLFCIWQMQRNQYYPVRGMLFDRDLMFLRFPDWKPKYATKHELANCDWFGLNNYFYVAMELRRHNVLLPCSDARLIRVVTSITGLHVVYDDCLPILEHFKHYCQYEELRKLGHALK